MVDSRGLKLSKRREPAPGEVGALVETYRVSAVPKTV